MPSTEVPAKNAIDVGHLRIMTCSDPALEREVLGLFASQTSDILQSLGAMPDNAPALAHTLKGSARAIGAFRVAEAADALEAAARTVDNAPAAVAQKAPALEALARLQREVILAQQAIAEMLRHSEP